MECETRKGKRCEYLLGETYSKYDQKAIWVNLDGQLMSGHLDRNGKAANLYPYKSMCYWAREQVMIFEPAQRNILILRVPVTLSVVRNDTTVTTTASVMVLGLEFKQEDSYGREDWEREELLIVKYKAAVRENAYRGRRMTAMTTREWLELAEPNRDELLALAQFSGPHYRELNYRVDRKIYSEKVPIEFCNLHDEPVSHDQIRRRNEILALARAELLARKFRAVQHRLFLLRLIKENENGRFGSFEEG